MVTARFDGGPLDGQTKSLPRDEPPLELHYYQGVVEPVRPGTPPPAGVTRYVLELAKDRKGAARYAIPTSER